MQKSVNTHNRLRYFFNKYHFLITGHVQVRTYDIHYKMCNNMFFIAYAALYGKA